MYLRSEVDEVRSLWNALGSDHDAHTAFIRERQTWLLAAQQVRPTLLGPPDSSHLLLTSILWPMRIGCTIRRAIERTNWS
jgi:hypothetical protein